ncbi:AER026Cp [Eremothecium gossypii ATCC 10895]|uniref:25S rRNA adenine-N(1) methyltransferase n=1 Tax=Eremothecium gossypii (strain ATCC 10895 / CBS 109.51 / FGSC 9923 / NRRL Y-1056) TaxID=284811 RepID=Q757I7_EREGS|nr:AER026Cp [Eremothecium gossypii ATCC 10895]AAS52710.1 AER026Cp [Eremothecium gossypii ATCC 10895]AEY97016.1 FAER026Cp [Eremothecium gossypii FDAG1]
MLARKRRSITGKSAVKHTPAIKPSKARKVIRRYHVLLQKRRAICKLLGIPVAENDEVLNERQIARYVTDAGLQEQYRLGADMAHPDEKVERELLKIQKMRESPLLVQMLGYVMAEINGPRGLQNYQAASTVGQTASRGGDTSRQLVPWLREAGTPADARALEIGALSAANCISTCGLLRTVVRIDLHSNDSTAIEEQDFMLRPLPQADADAFDLISCSLVLNFVPTPLARGEMLLRFRSFLRGPRPLLFIVLPLPCMENSRYMNSEYFCNMMTALGYNCLYQRSAKKLIYFLFASRTGMPAPYPLKYTRKHQLADGPAMNNFSITLPALSSPRI